MFDDTKTFVWTGVICLLATVASLHQIVMHLYHYTQPAHQRYIIRILFMVPIYAICSWISLADRHFGLYLETFRDCYESWVVYNFLSLCLAYVGGPGNVINRMAGKEIAPSWLAMTCCLPYLPVDGAYIRACKQGALQFVFLKPVIAVLTLLLTWAGVYGDQEIKADKAYPYIAFVYNMSYSVALYSLLLFYLGAHDLLKPHSPLLKFVLVKSVIFLTFWQSILCATLVSNGTLEDGEDGRALQNVLICVEMIVAACMMRWAFPHDVYRDENDGGAAMGRDSYSRGGGGGFMTNVGHAISLDDVVSDTVHQFAPTYQEYVLHGNEGGAPRKVRLKTHVMMGAEMIAANNRGRASAPPRRASDGRSSLSREGGPPNGRRSSGGGARGPGGKNEADGAGMLANAGFENSYGTRDVEDDLEDDFGAWSDDEEKQQQPGTPVRGASAGAGRDHRARGNGGAAARASAFAPGGAMAPLGAESRVGAGNVFDMVAELAAPDDSPAKPPPPPPPPPPTTTTTTTATERGGGGVGAAAGGGGLFQGAGGGDQARRYAATSIAPLAPPPSFRVAPPPGGPRAEGPTSPEFSSFVRAPSREHGEP